MTTADPRTISEQRLTRPPMSIDKDVDDNDEWLAPEQRIECTDTTQDP